MSLRICRNGSMYGCAEPARGREVARLVEADLPAGRQTARWEGREPGGSPLASGLYPYRLEVGSFVQVRSMVLMK